VTWNTIVPTPGTYRNERTYPFCPGCGHGAILDALDRSLVEQGLDPAQVVIVSDIGCSGLSDQYFSTSAFHGLHGRSVTYATGIKLKRPDLHVIVLMGDGGTGIGGTHLLSAARRNIGVTVIVFNNLNFGMTGGQHSTATPTGAVTPTTPLGNLERPLDICATIAPNGPSYVYRGTTFDADLPARITEAMRCGGFALLDVWELCTAYYAKRNKLSRKALGQTIEDLGFATGVLHSEDRPEYAAAYRAAAAGLLSTPARGPEILRPSFESALGGRFCLVVAGSAGGRIRSATQRVAQAALRSGLWAAQSDDYPITVKSGHSVSTLILDREEIRYTGVTRPDASLLLTEDGRRKTASYLASMTADDIVFSVPGLGPFETAARVEEIDPKSLGRTPRAGLARALVAEVVTRLGVLSRDALDADDDQRVHRGRPSHAL